jgi:signal transduction histidine kinase
LNRQTDVPDGDLLAAIAHDLRHPLTRVRLGAQILRREAERAAAPPTAWLTQGLADIEEAATRMAQLIDEIVDLARIRAGDPLHLNRDPTDLAALAARAAADAHASSQRHGVRLDLAEPSMIGRWDAARLRRVLENLLSNAIKYSPHGGAIVVRVARDGERAVLVVRDHGCGIPAADQPHIFEPFWRGSNVDQVPGSGLGLTSVKQIIEAHGGSVTVESGEGQGTTVTVRLPRE